MAWTRHVAALADPLHDLRLNLASHLTLLQALRARPAGASSISGRAGSTDDVVGAEITEDDADEPAGRAGRPQGGRGTRTSEFLARLRGFDVVSLRLPNCFGEHQPTDGEDIGLVGGFIRDAAARRDRQGLRRAAGAARSSTSATSPSSWRRSVDRPLGWVRAAQRARLRRRRSDELAARSSSLVGAGASTAAEMPRDVAAIDPRRRGGLGGAADAAGRRAAADRRSTGALGATVALFRRGAGVIWRCDLVPQYLDLQGGDRRGDRSACCARDATCWPSRSQAFEEEFARYLGVRHVVGVEQRHRRDLMLALRALGVGPGDEVITTPFTAIPTYVGDRGHAAPRRCSSTSIPDTFLIDLDQVRGGRHAADARGGAGAPVRQRRRRRRGCAPSSARRIRIIEDARRRTARRCRGRARRALGDVGAFSFYPTKNLGAYGDGGAVATNDREVAGHVSDRGACTGWSTRTTFVEDGINSRLDELQAAVLRVKLRHLDAMNARRARSRPLCTGEVLDRGCCARSAIADGVVPNYHVFAADLRAGSRRARRRARPSSRSRPTSTTRMPLYRQKPGYRGATPPLAGRDALSRQHHRAADLCRAPGSDRPHGRGGGQCVHAESGKRALMIDARRRRSGAGGDDLRSRRWSTCSAARSATTASSGRSSRSRAAPSSGAAARSRATRSSATG